MSAMKTKYVVFAVVVVGVFSAGSVFVTFRLAEATQLPIATKIGVCALLWGFVCYAIFMFVKYYRKLDREL